MNTDFKKNHNIDILGNGEKRLLFIHGFASSQEAWKWITPAFENDYTLVLVDLIGSGKSDKRAYDEERYQSLMGYVDDLIEVCDALEMKDTVIIGHSVGGTIGLLLANKRPDLVKQVQMIGASPRYLNDLPDYIGGFERENVEQILEMMELNYAGWASYLAPVALPEVEGSTHTQYVEASFISSDLKEVETDTVILQCSEDSFVPIEAAEYMAQEIKNSHLHVLSAKGHYPHVSHPEETIAAIKRYLK